MHLFKAAFAYFAIVFAVGFLCGPIRIFWLEPNFGATTALLVELPILLMAMLYAARFVPRRWRVPATLATHLSLGALALLMVLLADFGVGLFLRGQTLGQILAHFVTPTGRIYAVALGLFALMPALVNRRSPGAGAA